MKNLEKFLFFYSIIVINVLFTVIGVISPKPVNIISISLLLPLLIYFWIRLTSPKGSDPVLWSLRFFLSIFAVSVIAVLGFIYNKNTTNRPIHETTDTVVKTPPPSPSPLISPSPKAEEKGESIADIIIENENNEKTSLWITGKNKEKEIDVYSENSFSSQKIGVLDPELNYPYLEIKNNWYKVVIDTDTSGWINSEDVYETD